MSPLRRPRIFAIAAVTALTAASMSGCAASHIQFMREIRADLDRADFAAAYGAYKKKARSTESVDKLLNLGLLAFEANDLPEVQRALAAADQHAEEALTKSVSRELLSLVTSDANRAYPGTAFDRAMLHYYRALAYVAANDTPAAVVEGRAIATFLDVNARDGKNHYRDDAFLQWFSGSLYASAGQDNDAWISYKRARELFADYYEVAEPSFLCPLTVQAAQSAGVPDAEARVPQACLEAAQRLHEGWGRVIVLCEAGQVPPLLEQNIVFPFLKTDRRAWKDDTERWDTARHLYERGPQYQYQTTELEYLLRVALPYYPPDYTGSRVTGVAVREHDDLQADAELSQNMSAILRRDLDDRMGSIAARAIVRGLVKYAATKAVEPDDNDDKKDGDKEGKKKNKKQSWLEKALPDIVNAIGVLTESADTRSWETLPDRIYVADFQLPPGYHELSAEFRDRAGARLQHIDFPGTVVKKNQIVFLRARCPQ